MEKLVRRHWWKEPGHLACRVGSIVSVSFIALAALPSVHAQTRGNPAKVIRINPVEDLGLRVASPGAESDGPMASTDDAAPTETITSPEPEPVLIVRAEPPRHRANVIVLTTGPYLPVTGSLPLRFSSTRSWPPPRPRPEAPTEAATVSRDESPSVAPEPAPIVATEDSVPPAVVPVVIKADPTSAPTDHAAQPTGALSADTVLGFLDNLPHGESRVSVQFEPAIPERAKGPSGPLSR